MRLPILLVLLVAVCAYGEEIEISGLHGVIRSRNTYPEPYADNVNNTWRITVRDGYRVELHFTTFDLEDSYDVDEDNISRPCVYDFVRIQGYNRLCGNHKVFPMDAPRPGQFFRSSGSELVLNFVSDYANEDPKPIGFEAHWREIDVDECFDLQHKINSGVDDWDQILYCNHFCHNVGGSYYCSCRPGFTLDVNKHTCVANCESEIAAGDNGGSIESTDYPIAYGKLSNCETVLQANVGMRMDARFDEVFGIEDHYEEGCVYDSLQITDDHGNEERYCGDAVPENGSWILFNSNRLRIHFFSDLTVEKNGYMIHYRTYRVKCLESLQAPGNGSISKIPDKEELEYEDEIYFQCNKGFRMMGSNISACTATGEWSSPTPTCHIKYCPRPDELLNLPRINPPMFEEAERPYNSTLTIPCINKYYQLQSGSSEWICSENETWVTQGQIVQPNEYKNYPECRPHCGIKNARSDIDFFAERDPITGLILGGRDASREGEWPWMAFIDIGGGGVNTTSLKTFCGGSLVDEQYVVTAAHCFRPNQRISGRGLTVYLGVTNRLDVLDMNTSNIQVFEAESVERHQDFASDIRNLFEHDIAVIRLERPAVIGRFVRPICLPRRGNGLDLPQTSTKKGVVIGWGKTTIGIPAEILQVVRVPYVNATYCAEIYRDQSQRLQGFNNVMVTQNHFCAGTLETGKDACDGDSGGPLMWRNEQRQWFLNGIVSFATSLGECENYTIGVYTNVANYGIFLANQVILDPLLS